MKKCPVCSKKFTRAMMASRRKSQSTKDLILERMVDGKHIVRCPHCESRLRKNFIGFFIALIPFIVSTVIYALNHRYAFLIYLSIVIFMIVYINLPYTPYDS